MSPTATNKTIATLVVVVALGPALFVAALVTGLVSAMTEPATLEDGLFNVAGRVAGAVSLVLMLVLLAGLLVTVYRDRTWLEGTVAFHQGPFRIRSIDLATAEVSGEAATLGGRNRPAMIVPRLVARDPSTGESLKIRLRGNNKLKLLPEAELIALAEAIMASRRPTDPGYAKAEAVANRMREMAIDPFPV